MSDDQTIVIKGGATPAEVAAVVAAVATLRSSIDTPARKSRSLWALPARQIRPMLSAGPGAWRASSMPR